MKRLNSVFIAGIMFIIGWFGILRSLHVAQSAVAPTVDTVTATDTSGGTNIITFNLVESTTKTLYVHGQITDGDGCEDVATNGTVTGKFYRTNHASGDGCTADNNDCYTIINANCAKTGCTGPGDNSFNYECTAAIQYYADSTSNGTYSATDWTAKITATDGGSLTGSGTDAIEMGTLVSLDVTAFISYGVLALDQESVQQTVAITNAGNSGLDIDLSVSGDMNCSNSGSIAAGNARYSGTSGFAWADGTALSITATEFELNLGVRTDDSAPITKDLYFKLKTPVSGAGGSCQNTMTTTAKADTENGW